MQTSELPPEFQKEVTQEFAGETIRWVGQPSPWGHFWRETRGWLFGIPATAFGVMWQMLALAAFFDTGIGTVAGVDGALAYIFPALGLPFLLIGLGLMGKPLAAWWKARQTVIVLTDQRIAALRCGSRRDVTSIDVTRIASIRRTVQADGSGTLELDLGAYLDSDGDRVEKTFRIAGVRDVGQLERELVTLVRSRPHS